MRAHAAPGLKILAPVFSSTARARVGADSWLSSVSGYQGMGVGFRV